jgi:hypothetical protein
MSGRYVDPCIRKHPNMCYHIILKVGQSSAIRVHIYIYITCMYVCIIVYTVPHTCSTCTLVVRGTCSMCVHVCM